jgi:glycosyltransferase involved in cell wall biosynthesis
LYLPRFRGWPRVFEEAEVGQVFDAPAARGAWVGRARHALTRMKYGAFTRHVVEGCSRTTVVSEHERQRLVDVGCSLSRVKVIPNGVDGRCLDIRVPKLTERLVYSGALTFSANFDAVHYFLGKILPEIRRARPAAVLHVTGDHAGVQLKSLPNRDHLVLTGHLEDVQSFVAASSVCVVPLRLGGGTRLKILEAMALGTPVVSTTKGAEGLDVVAGRHLLVADRPGDFANAVGTILDNPALAIALTDNARQLVAEKYTWSRIAGVLDEVLQEAVETERAWRRSA